MTVQKSILVLLSTFILTSTSYTQTGKKVTDYLNIPGPVVFDKKSYSLSWSSHPSATYYKHEYIPAGENADKFKSMILLEVVTGNSALKDIVAAKVEELKKMKETNPAVNYEIFDNQKTSEYMIDFLLTANTPAGKINIAERNVYRYKIFTDASGKKGILLFGISSRAYSEEAVSFITSLKTNKKILVNQVAQFNIPAIKISRQ